MRNYFSFIFIFFLLLGCSKPEMGALSQDPSAEKSKTRSSAHGYLAYEHTVSLDLEESKLRTTFEALKNACEQSAPDPCELLAADVDTGRFASANLKIRTTEVGVQELIQLLSQHGTIFSS